jgi:hypothetical protein
MVSTIAKRCPKTVAWCLFFIFYFQMVAAAFTTTGNRVALQASYSSGYAPQKKKQSKQLFGLPGNETSPAAFKETKSTTNKSEINFIGGKDISVVPTVLPSGENKALIEPSKTNGPGPGQPEMQSFKSVGASNMVDMFSGDFSYNLPLLDVGGYPVGIHYNSGITMDQEASWVGLGWNINPGVINRSVRGLPDDFNGTDAITKVQNVKTNKTTGGAYSRSFELFGKKLDLKSLKINLGVKAGIFYNNYKGWGVEYGVSPSMSTSLFSKGSLTAGLSISNNSQTGLDVSPSFGVGISTKQTVNMGLNATVSSNYNSRTGISGLQMGLSGSASRSVVVDQKKDAEGNIISKETGIAGQNSSYPVSSISFVKPSFSPTISMPYTNESYNFSLAIGTYGKLKEKSYGTISGYTSKNYIAAADMTQTMPAYGYLYYQKAKDAGDNVLMDFNRDKEVPYRPNTPSIGVPSYTYDVYAISGEGIGGSFRPYRGDVGFVFDHTMRTKSKSGNFGLDLGIGKYVQIGVDIDKTTNQTVTSPWKTESNILAKEIGFKNEDNTIAEPVYFKNPGEKVKVDKNYFEAIGDTDLVNIGLVGISSKNSPDPVLNNSLNRYKNQVFAGTVPLKTDTYKKERDKRTQVISYLTADLASKFALDTLIKVYDLNAIPSLGCLTNYATIKRNEGIRKSNHLSEISVLNNDGKRYIYGIPAYNNLQQETSFAVNKDNADVNTGLVGYTPGNENSTANSADKTDNYFSKENTPSFAHSFLLSSILSADYVDVSGNGLSEDDQGDAIKFNYSKVYGENTGFYRWRAPYVENKASYGEGLKSDRRDDRGSYTYGEKEVWYLNSVESKNMIGVFVVETDPAKVRKDMFGVKNENGGKDAEQKQYQLKEINLYTKADLIKYGAAKAKPIKTVHFEYDYSLCKNHPGSESTTVGKLTLRKIWFSYNKNEKGIQNPYVFRYDKDVIDVNGNVTGNNSPTYNNKSYDRWGNFKDPSANLGPTGDKFTNADFPYSTQDAAIANQNSSAWSLNEILMPSGSKIKVTYEADDYGYVQNKRAMQMMGVAGFGKESTDVPQADLFKTLVPGSVFSPTCNYIFIKVPDQVNSKEELYRKYLEGVKKVFVKFNMNVRTDTWGGGSELVPCYFDIDDYGIKGNAADKIIWIKPKDVDGKNAFLLATTQFLRMNLYSKAYPASEPGDDITIKTFVIAMFSVFGNIKNAVAGFYNYTLTASPVRIKGVVTEKSFARLNNPFYKKYGGGHRVKRVEIFDNWNKMTATQQRESVYGQDYDYTTTVKDEAGADKVISSGVASYEPIVGRDENPFITPFDTYKEKVGVAAPTDYFYTDDPVMESFYPSAMVGYSRVKVRSINRDHKSSNGFHVTEFYTTKDFPTRSSYTPLVEGESRYTYQNPKPKKLSFFKFNPKTYVSLSQGFKVELNDMNGKVKRTATYKESDSVREVSSTKNYYRLENDRLENRLSNRVQTIDSANGIITKDAEMGKEVELMVDLRQQLSVTRSSSKQFNLLIQKIDATPFFLPLPMVVMYRKSEINRYRSAAVTKVINQYGILDSVVVMDKGSKVTTRNLVYDSETGEVLLTRTNNEFDDPIYNFNYPAHWAYSGMGSAYKNIQKTITGQNILNGVLKNRANETFFESGDEIILTEKEPKRTIGGIIVPKKYDTRLRKIWAIDAAKGKENNKGIYFIDGNGSPVNTPNNELATMTILRSGKRNMLGAGVGSVTAMANPIRQVGADSRIIFDSTSRVIASSAGRYKDFWRVDSTVSPVDTFYKVPASGTLLLPLKRNLLLKQYNYHGNTTDHTSIFMATNIAAQVHHLMDDRDGKRGRTNALYTKSIIDFDLKQIPIGATITSAKLTMSSMSLRDTTYTGGANRMYSNGIGTGSYTDNTQAHYNYLDGATPSGNAIYLTRLLTNWDKNTSYSQIQTSMGNDGISAVIPGTSGTASCDAADINNKDISPLVQSISDNRDKSFGIVMQMANGTINSRGGGGGKRYDERRSRSYYAGNSAPITNTSYNSCYTPTNTNAPSMFVAFNYMKDTSSFTCRPSIRPDAINPYKFGVLGNWRMERAYSYYDSRKEADASVETNIRTNGEIKGFLPYWSFSTGYLKNNTADTAVRWVWNSEMNMFNRKGMEIENRDPLNRYNSGQYGYNKNLPVAVTQNSKSRNMTFDGFEDYDYKTSYCEAECQADVCLPTGYNTVLNNCDTLNNAMTGFMSTYSIPNPVITRNSSGCDTSTWYFPQCPVSNSATSTTSTAYHFQSMFYNGVLGYPDSAQVLKGINYTFQVGYKRNICLTTPSAVYEANFKTIPITGTTPLSVFFLVPVKFTNNSTGQMQVTIAHSGSGSIALSGFTAIARPDLSFNFFGSYRTLRLVYRADDTIEVRVNNILLGKLGSSFAGVSLVKPWVIPTLQFNRLAAKIDWIKYYDGNGKVALDEQFNGGCTTLAMPKPDFDCAAKPECSIAFTNYFNNRFKTVFTYAQIGALYSQCNIKVGPCGDTMPNCNTIQTTISRASGFDRFVDFTKGGGSRDTVQKHTGKFSFKVGANKTSGNVIKIASLQEDALVSSLSIKIDTVAFAGASNVIPKGTGLLTNYNVWLAKKAGFLNHSINGCMGVNISPDNPRWNPTTEYSSVDKNWDYGSPKQFNINHDCAPDFFTVQWTGKLQPNFTAKHIFRLDKGTDDNVLMYLDGTPVNFTFKDGEWKTDSIALQSCRLYNIKIVFSENEEEARCRLLWSNPYAPEPTIIPLKNFYPPTATAADTAGSCLPVALVARMNGVKPSNMHNPLFSPVAGTQILVGAWVKEGQPCYTGSYANAGIDVVFAGTSISYALRPSGNIIEGWQRIEGFITIPANATSMNIGLRSLGNTDVYFDDIRVHPFNANMKSFVYNPSNLRLMSELDENNYASFYEYDDDGTLIRVKKETERGIKTIQETRSALFKQ